MKIVVICIVNSCKLMVPLVWTNILLKQNAINKYSYAVHNITFQKNTRNIFQHVCRVLGLANFAAMVL